HLRGRHARLLRVLVFDLLLVVLILDVAHTLDLLALPGHPSNGRIVRVAPSVARREHDYVPRRVTERAPSSPLWTQSDDAVTDGSTSCRTCSGHPGRSTGRTRPVCRPRRSSAAPAAAPARRHPRRAVR